MGYGLPPRRQRSTINAGKAGNTGSSRSMEEKDPHTITLLLGRLGAGDEAATAELWPLVYRELHRMAEVHMAHEQPGRTLQPTALVHEVWLYMVQDDDARFPGRAQFFRMASKVMRSVLVDAARARSAKKRGGGLERITLDGDVISAEQAPIDLLELDRALDRLEEQEPELARIVEMRFFGGMKHPAIAEALGVSLRSVERSWRFARTWLFAELTR